MTNKEFSNEFDVIYNNITSNSAPGLNEYEKSVFLTRAEYDIVRSYYNPRTNKPQQGYDGSELRQVDFSKITIVKDEETFSDSVFDPRPNNKSVILPPDLFIPINESLTVTRDGGTQYLQVIPVTYDEYRRLMSKPYKRPLKYQAWRLMNTSAGDNTADIIAGQNDTITKYSIRYVRRPLPIILDRLVEDQISLGGGYVGADADGNPTKDVNEAVSGIECELDEVLHPDILQRAVELAKASYTGDLTSQVALGQTSQTEIGAVTQGR